MVEIDVGGQVWAGKCGQACPVPTKNQHLQLRVVCYRSERCLWHHPMDGNVAADRSLAYAEQLRRNPAFLNLVLANAIVGINRQRLLKQSSKRRTHLELAEVYADAEKLGILNTAVVNQLQQEFRPYLSQPDLWQEMATWVLTRLDSWQKNGELPSDCLVPGALSIAPDPTLPEAQALREALVLSACAFYQVSELLDQVQIHKRSLAELEHLLGLDTQHTSSTKPPLFQHGEFEKIATGYPILTGAQALINSQWQDGDYPYWRKVVGKGFVEHNIIRQDPATSRIELVPGKAAWEIIQQFGPEAAYIFLIFSSYATDTEKPWEERIRLKGTDLIRLYGWDKRTDLSRGAKLKKIGKLVELVCSLSVLISNIDIGAKRYNVATSPMWLLESLEYSGQLTLTVESSQLENPRYEAEDPDELIVQVRPGQWTETFLNQYGQQEKEALRQYGYLAKSTLQINPYRHRLAAKLAIFLTVMSRIRHNGRYEVRTLLERLEHQGLLAQIQHSKSKRNELIEQWDGALLTLKDVGWQIEFDADTYPMSIRPLWSLGDEESIQGRTRPKNWLNLWLKAIVVIQPTRQIQRQLETIRKPMTSQRIANAAMSSSLVPTRSTLAISGALLEEALAMKGLSRARLASQLGLDRSMVTRWINGSRSIQGSHQEELWQLLGTEFTQLLNGQRAEPSGCDGATARSTNG